MQASAQVTPAQAVARSGVLHNSTRNGRFSQSNRQHLSLDPSAVQNYSSKLNFVSSIPHARRTHAGVSRRVTGPIQVAVVSAGTLGAPLPRCRTRLGAAVAGAAAAASGPRTQLQPRLCLLYGSNELELEGTLRVRSSGAGGPAAVRFHDGSRATSACAVDTDGNVTNIRIAAGKGSPPSYSAT